MPQNSPGVQVALGCANPDLQVHPPEHHSCWALMIHALLHEFGTESVLIQCIYLECIKPTVYTTSGFLLVCILTVLIN